MIIDTLQNQKLATYYKSNEISNSLKSMIHVKVTYEIQLPDKVWALIKQFMIFDKDECIFYQRLQKSKEPYIIHRGKIFTLSYVFNNARLTELYLSENQITDITALGNALNTNSTLRTLSLSYNLITDITALGNALNTNSTLTELNLESNQITDNDKNILRQAWGNRSSYLYL